MKVQKKSREQVKAELLAMAEERIEELLSWGETTERPSLSAIEGTVLRIREEISVKLAEAVINQQEKEQRVPGPSCPGCEREMSYKDSHPLHVTSWVGDLQLERGYYYCAGCQRGFFPLGRAVRHPR